MQKRILCCLLCLAVLVSAPLCGMAGGGATYEIFVGSFYDSNGDGLGDLPGVTQKLDYVAALGAGAIWLMPISPSPTYHKYDVTDYLNVDAGYGTLTDFDALTAAAKEKGIDIILDLVVNHTSSEHPWFTSACQSIAIPDCGAEGACTNPALCRRHNPYCDYYHFTQEKSDGYAAVPGAEGWYYECRFWSGMPDLNLDSAAVRGELESVMAFWLAHGASGFRLDAVTSYYTGSPKSNVTFTAWLVDAAKQIDPGCTFVGEVWTDAETLLSYYPSGIGTLFDFPLAQQDGAIATAVKSAAGAAYARKLCEWNRRIRDMDAAAIDAPFLSNHDMNRSAGYFPRNDRQHKLAAALVLLGPGRPFLYYGEELGLTGSGKDENKRMPMLWSAEDNTGACKPPKGVDQVQRLKLGAKEQESDPESLLCFYRALGALRRQAPQLDTAAPELVDTGCDAVAAYRCDDATVLVNLGEDSVTMPQSGTLLGALGTGDGEPTLENGTLLLPGGSVAVLVP